MCQKNLVHDLEHARRKVRFVARIDRHARDKLARVTSRSCSIIRRIRSPLEITRSSRS
jgi:hypothetical protein